MQLLDSRCELVGEIWYDRSLVATGGDDDAVCAQLTVRCLHTEAPVDWRQLVGHVAARQALDPYTASYRKIEVLRVGLQIVGHLVMGGEGVHLHRPTRQAGVPRDGEQSQRVPAVPPGVANAGVGIENDELLAGPLQVVSDRQTCLPSTNDHCRNRFDVVR
jgi:hypothetical protein